MDYKKLYDSIENPLNDQVLDILISNYSADKHDTYYFLTHAYAEQKPDKRFMINTQDRDKYFSNLFNRWKYMVSHETPEYIEYLIKYTSVEKDYYELAEMLKKMPDIHSYKEYDDLLWNEDRLSQLIDKYGWEIGRGSSWIHANSYYINGRVLPRVGEIEHRLYLNIDSEYLYKACNKFIGLCLSKDLPFYFKSTSGSTRDDTVVIYSDSAHLEDYINIVRELSQIDPEFMKHVHNPPILTGLIDGWIGYGSEPSKLPNGSRTSFNEVRSDIIDKSIKSSTLEWLKKNKDLAFDFKGKTLTVQQLLGYQVANKKIRELCSMDDDKLMKRYGITKASLTKPEVVKKLYSKISNRFDGYFEGYLKNGEFNITDEIVIKAPKGDIKIIRYDMNKVINGFAESICKIDPNFKKSIKQKIISESQKKGIDTRKFCFDVDKRDKLISMSSNQNKKGSQL